MYDRVVVYYPSGLEWFFAYSNKGCVYRFDLWAARASHPRSVVVFWAKSVGYGCLLTIFAHDVSSVRRFDRPLDSLPLQPPHSANRHDARCRGAGADRVGGKIMSCQFEA